MILVCNGKLINQFLHKKKIIPTWFQGLGDIKSKAILFNLEVQGFMHFFHFIPLRLRAKYEWMLTQSTNVDINDLVSCLKKKI